MDIYNSMLDEYNESLQPKQSKKEPIAKKIEPIPEEEILITPRKFPPIQFNNISELLNDPFSQDTRSADKYISSRRYPDDLPKFKDIKISTKTVIAVTNMTFN